MSEDALEALDRMVDEDSRRRRQEMDRLHARLDEALGARDHFRAEVDRLQKCFGTIDRLRKHISKQNARIAEIDAAWERFVTQCLNYADILLDYARSSNDDKPITEEQIDAAWDHAQGYRYEPLTYLAITGALADLGIVVCEECGGSGGSVITSTDGVLSASGWRFCPACQRNGKSHGWVWAGGVSNG